MPLCRYGSRPCGNQTDTPGNGSVSASISPRLAAEFFDAVRGYIRWSFGIRNPVLSIATLFESAWFVGGLLATPTHCQMRCLLH